MNSGSKRNFIFSTNKKSVEISDEIKQIVAAAENCKNFHNSFAFPIMPEPKKGKISTFLEILGL